jgi:hypothetical protein
LRGLRLVLEASLQLQVATLLFHSHLCLSFTFLQGLCLVLEAILQLRGLRPGLDVKPIQHDAFFVEEPPPEPAAAAEGGQLDAQGGDAGDVQAAGGRRGGVQAGTLAGASQAGAAAEQVVVAG